MAKKIRLQRVAEAIQNELSKMLLYEITDPDLQGVSVTGVDVDREMAFATVYVSAMEGSEREAAVLDGFERAKGFLRYQLSQLIDLRSFPRLRFKWDATAERAARIEELLNKIQEEKKDDDETPDA
jgi:ribosome-binding factor A